MPSWFRNDRGTWAFRLPGVPSLSLRPLQVALGGDISEDVRGVLVEMVGRALESPRRKPGPKTQSATASFPPPAKVIERALEVLAIKGKDGTLKNRRSQWHRLLGACGNSWGGWLNGNAVGAIREIQRSDGKAPLGRGGKKALYDALGALIRIAREDLRLDLPDSIKQGSVWPRYESERDDTGLPPEDGLPAFSVEEARALLSYAEDLADRFTWFPQALRVAFLMGMHQVDMNSLRSSHLHQEEGSSQLWIKKPRAKNGSLWINAPVHPLMFHDRDMRLVKKPIVPVKTNAGEVLRECADLAGVKWVTGNAWLRTRRTFASVIEEQYGAAVLRCFLGHSRKRGKGKTWERYVRAEETRLKQAAFYVGYRLLPVFACTPDVAFEKAKQDVPDV